MAISSDEITTPGYARLVMTKRNHAMSLQISLRVVMGEANPTVYTEAETLECLCGFHLQNRLVQGNGK